MTPAGCVCFQLSRRARTSSSPRSSRASNEPGWFYARGSPERVSERPPEVDLDPADPVPVEPEHLRVPEPASVPLRALVRHDDLVARLDHPLHVEGLDLLAVRPAPLEVRVLVDSDVGRAVEDELVVQEP